MWGFDRRRREAEQGSDADAEAGSGEASARRVEALGRVVDELLDRIGRILADVGDAAGTDVSADLERLRAGVHDHSVTTLSKRRFGKRFEFIDRAAEAQRAYLTELHEEFRHVISLLSDALVALNAENADYHAEIRNKLDDMVRVSRIEDIRSLKSTLESEIRNTRQIVQRKRRNEARSIDALAGEVSTLSEELNRARAESRRDDLTGVGNRRALDAYLDDLVADASGSIGSLLIVDLDDFKHINDRYGHAVGDRALCAATTLLGQRIRSEDLLARLGGDEFVVVLRGASMRNAERVAEEMRDAMATTRFTFDGRDPGADDNDALAMTVSVGIAQHVAGETVSELMERADRALYRAKSGGKNRLARATDG